MKKIFIDARSDQEINLPEEIFRFKGRLGLFTTIQHLHKLDDIQKKIPNSVIGGQILGCKVDQALKINDQVDSYLFIGSGKFHPLAVAQKTKKKVFCFDPFNDELSEVSAEEIEKLEKKKKGAYLSYLYAEKIGILVSQKEGQENLELARDLKKRITGKKVYILLSDLITPSQIDHFNFIDCFINTACPRIFEDQFNKPIINAADLISYLDDQKLEDNL